MEDHECMVVTRIQQGVGVALTALQLLTGQDFCEMAPEFLDHARQAELVGGFAATVAAIVATISMEDILHSGV